VKEASRKYFDTLFNTYKFFSQYARAENWKPSEADPVPSSRPIVDRWVLSRLNSLVATVEKELELFHVSRAYWAVGDFLNDDLSNWYVRRSRARFWGNSDSEDARAAFRTLWEVLVTVSRLVAPITPFVGDWLHRALADGESVHLASFPRPQDELVDRELEEGMEGVRALVSLGRAAREEVRIRVRQPLGRMFAVTPEGLRLEDDLLGLLKDELNVKEVDFVGSNEGLVSLVAKPNYRVLGPRFQKQTEEAATAIRTLAPQALAAYRSGDPVEIQVGEAPFTLEADELEVVEEAQGELVVQGDGRFTAALDPAISAELRREGLARELVNRIQRFRKESGLEITDRISLGIGGPQEVREAADAFREFIAGETLATAYAVEALEGDFSGYEALREVDLDGVAAQIGLSRVTG
jgi:isoleucyl-tRNA synthetase